jgi:anti-sigma factor RsiW
MMMYAHAGSREMHSAMTTYSYTDLDIQALVDNQLDWEEAKRVRAYIDATPSALKRYETLRQQKQLLVGWFQQSQVH